jgi:hypothetical protein
MIGSKPVTVSQLYSLYCAGHAEARRVSDGGVLRDFEVSVNGAGITALERVILELALHDATNGTPMRTRQGFDRAVRQGADLLGSLGLRIDREAAARTSREYAIPLDEAA